MDETLTHNSIEAFYCILQIWGAIITVGFIFFINYKVTKEIEKGNRD